MSEVIIKEETKIENLIYEIKLKEMVLESEYFFTKCDVKKGWKL